ncbi:MAG: 1-acyl-sn-glycerol-3-phosphate acyltransferase [Firmicutes bacterium]|nr:1-acyl-sn-glycerol-3-phosphate acyltransferase [Bacillota bacterium]MCL1944948.1 1-acyl-sn-glycerol-3-phosphate acyltransferase [Bacillota bacterium]MCL1954241.1 1-acyl-sn-glycerol-3-phosphate acyltransferase [Bacillota bacterium]
MALTTTIDNTIHIPQAQDRLDVLQKIAYNERHGLFHLDVEADAPTVPIDVDKLDLLNVKWTSKIVNKIANFAGNRFFKKWQKDKAIYKGTTGLENLQGFCGSAMVTCNHCNIFDNYAAYLALKEHWTKRRFVLHKVVREGNYSYPGIIGYLMRHCNTLPVQETDQTSMRVTMETSRAIKTLLSKGKQVLIYPEQAMWWNYKKPRPFKKGAFHFAAKNNAPIIPLFITLKDSDKIGPDGFFVQEFVVNIHPIIYPDPANTVSQNLNMMMHTNYQMWKDTYEKVYDIPLEYTTMEMQYLDGCLD